MNKEEATKFLAIIKVAYPKSYRNMDRDSLNATINMWHKTFEDVPFKIMEMALDHYRKVSEFEPTIADMYKELKNVYYQALTDALTTESESVKKLCECIMQHTSVFKYDPVIKINYSSLNEGLLENKGELLSLPKE